MMAQTTLTVSASTWILENNSSTHASDTLLKTNRYYNEENNYYAVLQFTLSNTLKYKHITRAVLRFHTQGSGTSVGAQVAPYYAGNVLSSLSGTNINSNGTLGEKITVKKQGTYKVTNENAKSPEVSFQKPANKKAKTIKVLTKTNQKTKKNIMKTTMKKKKKKISKTTMKIIIKKTQKKM